MKKTATRIKPSKVDISFTYICQGCGEDHWVTLKENQTKDFMIVCNSCDTVMYTTPLSKISLRYAKEEKEQIKPEPSVKQESSLIERCAKSLVYYGFDKLEAITMATEACSKYDTSDIGELVKKIIFDFGELDATSKV